MCGVSCEGVRVMCSAEHLVSVQCMVNQGVCSPCEGDSEGYLV